MKKSSMIFRLICMAVCFALCLSLLPVMAEELAEVEEAEAVVEETVEPVTETTEEMTEIIEDVVEDVTEDVTEEAAEEIVEDVTESAEEDEIVEVLDLFAATLRDGGVYVTPGDYNDAVFDCDGVRYKVSAGEGNLIKLDGFESDVTIEESISETAKNRLQANGEITVEAAHSGYFGLSAKAGEVVYRTAVTKGDVYVFSAWIKSESNIAVNDDRRAFYVVGESGESYIVGYNEIGREIAHTSGWQQIIFTFKAPETGLFAVDFKLTGKGVLCIDDLELYTAEVFENPLEIRSVECTDADGNSYNYSTGFTTTGTLTHTTVLYNSDEDDVYFNAVAVLFRNDIMVDFQCIEECALVLDETEVTFEIEIPDEGEVSEYSYMVYFISDTTPTSFYGYVPSRSNPYVVSGK